MSRSSTSSARNLSMTEELEKLEQSITLTLQEIDHNFSRAHRIVTTSILPIVEQYAEHSKAVWEGSKFWKQFFEASANVSLAGYEEPANDDSTTAEDRTYTTTDEETYTSSPSHANDTSASHAQASQYDDIQDDSILESISHDNAHVTPRALKNRPPPTATIADYPSPYETLKREIRGDTRAPSPSVSSELPSTPGGQQQALPDMSMSTAGSSPFNPTSVQPSTQRRGADLLLHRVLDKNYRLQATPHKTARAAATQPGAGMKKTSKEEAGKKAARWRDSLDLDSSPVIAAPRLHSDIFSSPVRGGGPRTPGVSVQTPMRKEFGTDKGKEGGFDRGGLWDSDSDDEGEGLNFSPPKTIQFHVPQSRLLQTPAREASKRIVEDLLLTAGGNVTDDLDESPSVIKRHEEDMDESF